MPAPSTDPGSKWLWDFLRDYAAEIASSFDFVQLPPWSLVQGGAAPTSDGYGVFQRRNLNGTRYGSLESLMSAIAALNANGCGVWGDLVLHQMSGENGGPGVFRYAGADGHTMNGRGQTTPGWFRGGTGSNDPIPPFRPEDDVPARAVDFPFGRELVYQNSDPPGISLNDATDYLNWVTRRTAAEGYRFDDTKGTYAPAVRQIMDSQPKLPFYSEYFDGDPSNLNGWATSPPMSSRSAVEDFTLHWRIQAACNGFNAAQLEASGAGYWQWNAGLSVGFVDNPDTDTSPGQQVISNKGLAYAYMLTLPMRQALIYGKDYFPNSVWPGAYGLKPLIDNLCWISRMFAFGKYQVRYADNDVHIASRDGDGGKTGWSGGLLTALNFNTLSARTIACSTPFGPHRWLHDYTGHHPDVWSDGSGNATFTIPANSYARGQSYLCFAPGGVNGPVVRAPQTTTQTFIASADLDILPARNSAQLLPQRIFCAANSDIVLQLSAQLPAGGSLSARVVAPDGSSVAEQRIGAGAIERRGHTVQRGWHAISVVGADLPSEGANFALTLTYMGAKQ